MSVPKFMESGKIACPMCGQYAISKTQASALPTHKDYLRLGLAVEALRKLDNSKALNAWGHMIVSDALNKIAMTKVIERPEDHPNYPFGKVQSSDGLDV